MGEVSYAPLIDDMVWSYSRIRTFEDCPYRWYLRYIKRFRGKDMFFSSYGTFMHKLIEQYLKGEKSPPQLVDKYLQDFKAEVVSGAPNGNVFASYFAGGLDYLRALRPLPYDIVAVEKKVDFKVGEIPFVGFIDVLGRKDGALYIIDNKSRTLKPRSSRKKPTKSDEELDAYLRQLYIYAAAVEAEYGERPEGLCFNCFRSNLLIEEPFKEKAYAESIDWLRKSIQTIRTESDFNPSVEFFKCAYLCEMQDMCEYFDLEVDSKSR